MNKNLELLKKIKNSIYSVLVILIFTACASSKHKLVKMNTTQKDSLISKTKSISEKTINQAIDDMIFLPLETGNTKVDSVINTRLSNFKTYKKSGANSYKITYNKPSKGFYITSKIGSTENALVKKIDSLKSIQKQVVIKQVEKTIIKYRTPGWLWIVFLILIVAVYVLSKLKII